MTEEYINPAELDAWILAHSAARTISTFDSTRPGRFSLGANGRLCPLALHDPCAVLLWNPSRGWNRTFLSMRRTAICSSSICRSAVRRPPDP